MVSRVNLKLHRPYLLAIARPTTAGVTRSRAAYCWPPEGLAPSSKRERFTHSALFEALERRRRQDEMSDHRRARRAEDVKRSRFDDGADPSGGQ
jgi:hypothetical protein